MYEFRTASRRRLGGDRGIGLALRDQRQNLALASCQFHRRAGHRPRHRLETVKRGGEWIMTVQASDGWKPATILVQTSMAIVMENLSTGSPLARCRRPFGLGIIMAG